MSLSRFAPYAVVILISTVLLSSAVWLSRLPEGGEASALPYVVNSPDDAVDASPGDGACATVGGACTLRAAVQESNALPGPNAIELGPGSYVLDRPGTGEDAALTGDLDITDSLTINGEAANETTVDGGGLDRVFHVDPAEVGTLNVDIRDLRITNGNAGAEDGGGIWNASLVTMMRVSVDANEATNGGGINNEGFLTLTDSSVSGNMAAVQGGGIRGAGDEALTNVTISGNSTPAVATAGIYNPGGDLILLNSTITDNTSGGSTGGLRSLSTATVKNTIIAGNSGPNGNCSGNMGAITSTGYNLEDSNTCPFAGPGDILNGAPFLQPLANNGGPTLTHALGDLSDAIDAGSPDCPPPDTDQRGAERPVDGDGIGASLCDIGAVEYGSAPPTPTPTPTAEPTDTPTPSPTPTPTPTTTPTPSPSALVQGDVNCDTNVTSVDSLGILRFVAGLPPLSQHEPCPDIGTGNGEFFGDVDCKNLINSVDALGILRFVAGLPALGQQEPCADIGNSPATGT